MKPLVIEKARAIALRNQGLSYTEIQQQVPVSQASLSLWLRNIPLTEGQTARLVEKQKDMAHVGGKIRHTQHVAEVTQIHRETEQDVGPFSKRDLWLMGIMLYWAEGSKEKERYVRTGFDFGNSDPNMIKIMLRWLHEITHVSDDQLVVGLYIHENHRYRIQEVKQFWSETTGLSLSKFSYVYFKQHIVKTKRSNTRDNYHGLLRLRARSSSRLQRHLAGWVRAINKQYWGVV